MLVRKRLQAQLGIFKLQILDHRSTADLIGSSEVPFVDLLIESFFTKAYDALAIVANFAAHRIHLLPEKLLA